MEKAVTQKKVMDQAQYFHDFMRHWCRMTHETYGAMRKLQMDFDLTGKQFGVLRIISWIEPANLSALKAFLPGHESGMSQIVDRLVRKKFIKREQDEEDRRKVTLSLDQSGRDVIAAMPVVGPSKVMQGMQSMNDEEAQALVRAMEMVATALFGEEDPNAPHTQLYKDVDWKVEEAQ